ncbi:16S rRNA (guanine(527)-N(7))-methyltransferase RsmG [Candidatus Peregrinibacteria bacterium CG10_big_fil_rev_8_21_14_0_10_49_24]|nr:MAG: 16S rRNA (guanine(527)-N(7))-methyltransferase RsmG [Candidatus Peregrinibacteria bacterium CG11_big_fil_rev_8_21_14_0_20_49_14]PIR51436.1 MAG: 16S rRNA (guanine(527)-N(7))-methyltransferase RsmG [Candidatus Peregrinibacteria bacterium CG10_big_fil_rev_8_21_14_0_10_49_24]PJA67372.1 MAG: 16S rRNA (guanine(527)-N(7))-methyltransferase RsmG [Candidatus Peregrinibacteria bacterium CG_4_9_14_3_um_filter_49_12]
MLDETVQNQLKKLTALFLEENTKLNLSAFRTEEDCWHGNVLDSLAATELQYFSQAKEGARVLDIGTGGGFPLLPLAIAYPAIRFTGLDSTQKKIDAIGRIVTDMGLSNVELICGRTEELGCEAEYREQFDIVAARALAPLNTLLEYASPFVKPKGHIVCWKSMRIEQELKDSLLARAELSCQLIAQHTYALPEKWGQRQLIIFEKRGPIAVAYPRAVGIPKKSPLL